MGCARWKVWEKDKKDKKDERDKIMVRADSGLQWKGTPRGAALMLYGRD
jgi:hypothetical protein